MRARRPSPPQSTESTTRSPRGDDGNPDEAAPRVQPRRGCERLPLRIVRQGRAFGIHVVLGSQTLGGAYTVARTTLGQMVIRIALQCNEADAYLIMDQDNPAPRLLSRPGEGIYNDAAGAIEGNSPFQVVWLSDTTRDRYLDIVHERAERNPVPFPRPIVFEGDALADVADNAELAALLESPPGQAPASPRLSASAPDASCLRKSEATASQAS